LYRYHCGIVSSRIRIVCILYCGCQVIAVCIVRVSLSVAVVVIVFGCFVFVMVCHTPSARSLARSVWPSLLAGSLVWLLGCHCHSARSLVVSLPARFATVWLVSHTRCHGFLLVITVVITAFGCRLAVSSLGCSSAAVGSSLLARWLVIVGCQFVVGQFVIVTRHCLAGALARLHWLHSVFCIAYQWSGIRASDCIRSGQNIRTGRIRGQYQVTVLYCIKTADRGQGQDCIGDQTVSVVTALHCILYQYCGQVMRSDWWSDRGQRIAVMVVPRIRIAVTAYRVSRSGHRIGIGIGGQVCIVVGGHGIALRIRPYRIAVISHRIVVCGP
jgi:hypothetical protein